MQKTISNLIISYCKSCMKKQLSFLYICRFIFQQKLCFEFAWNEGDSSQNDCNEDFCLHFQNTNEWCSISCSPVIWQQPTQQYIFHLVTPRSPASRHFHTAEELYTLKLEDAESISIGK